MPATPKYALPYPAGTDKVKDGYTAIRQLAEATETALGGARGRAYRQSNNFSVANDSGVSIPTNALDTDFSTAEFTRDGDGNLLYTGPDAVVIVVGSVTWEANGTGYRRLILEQNGSAQGVSQVDPDPGATTKQSTSFIVTVATGDVLGLRARQNTGAALNISDAELRAVVVGLA